MTMFFQPPERGSRAPSSGRQGISPLSEPRNEAKLCELKQALVLPVPYVPKPYVT